MNPNKFDAYATSKIKYRIKELIADTDKRQIREMFSYAMHQGEKDNWGSQSRGRLLLSITGVTPINLDVACSIEIWHNISLIIDDLLDDSSRRRGNMSFWRRFSKDLAYTMSFYLDRVATKLIHDKELFAVANIFNECTLRMATIEANNLSMIESSDQYIRNVTSKTAQFYISVCQAGNTLANAGISRELLSLIEYSGILHQYHDDAADSATEYATTKHKLQEYRTNWQSLSQKEKNDLHAWVYRANNLLIKNLSALVSETSIENKTSFSEIISEISRVIISNEKSDSAISLQTSYSKRASAICQL